MADLSTTPFAVDRYDNPETVRLRKYATGAHLILQVSEIETGRIPREVVWQEDKARLYRYKPAAEKRFPVPVLLVYALILRPYIVDLVPGNSLVEYLVNEGFDVCFLDWGVPGDEDRHLSLELRPGLHARGDRAGSEQLPGGGTDPLRLLPGRDDEPHVRFPLPGQTTEESHPARDAGGLCAG